MSSLIAEKNKLKIHLIVCVCFFSLCCRHGGSVCVCVHDVVLRRGRCGEAALLAAPRAASRPVCSRKDPPDCP